MNKENNILHLKKIRITVCHAIPSGEFESDFEKTVAEMSRPQQERDKIDGYVVLYLNSNPVRFFKKGGPAFRY